jgi:hypothetical protein
MRNLGYNRRMTTPHVPREEIAAAVSARRELGREYDDAFVESIVARVDDTIEARLATHAAARTRHEVEQARKGERRVYLTVVCVSLGLSVPLSAIALEGEGGLAGLLIVWLGIALINLFAAIRGWRQ